MNFKPTLSRSQKLVTGLFFVVAVVLQTPARLISLALPPEIRLHDVSGSFWRGKAAAIGLDGLIVQEQVEWDFQAGKLLFGTLDWEIFGRFGDHKSHLQLKATPGQIEANSIRIALPLEPLSAVLPQLKSIPLGGLATIEAAHVSRHRSPIATITLDEVFSPLAGQGELGNYRLEIRRDGDSVQWQVSTASGRLQLRGQGTLERNGIPHGQLSFEPRSDIPGISALLATLAKKDGSQFQWSF